MSRGRLWLDATAPSSHAVGRLTETSLAGLSPPWWQTVPSATAVQQAWARHVNKLSNNEKALFLKHQQGDLDQYVRAIKSACQNQQDKSRSLKIAKLVGPLFKTTEMYAPGVKIAVQAYPNPSSLILGGILCIVEISARYVEYQERLSDMLSTMGKKAEILTRFGDEIYATEDTIQLALAEVYGDILDFCREASGLLFKNEKEKTGFRILKRSLWEPFESKLGAIMQKFDQDLDIYKLQAELCTQRREEYSRVMQHHSTLLQFQMQQGLASLQSSSQSMLDHDERRQTEEDRKRREDGRILREKKRQLVIQWVPSISFVSDYEERYHERLEGTGEWLLGNATYRSWKAQDTSGLLWVKGKHGCGKSVLSALVISDLEQRVIQGAAVAYVYCNAREDSKRNPLLLMCSILKQLCHQTLEIDTTLEDIFDRKAELQGDGPGWRQVGKATASIASKFMDTFIVVDGLDECEGHERISSALLSLSQERTSTVKTIIFSRPKHVLLEKTFGECPQLMVDSGENEGDIRAFIAHVLSEGDLAIDDDKALLEEVKSTLLNGADGMFLWVNLMVQTLREQDTPNQVREKVMHHLPKGLDEAYDQSMRRICTQADDKKRQMAIDVLLWTVNSKRPLSRAEILEALMLKPGMTDLCDGDRMKRDRGLAALCADLVVVDSEGYFHPVHSSLKEYLLSLPKNDTSPLEHYRLRQVDANNLLGEMCLTYLLFDKFKIGPVASVIELEELRRKNPLLEYASTHWGHHLRGKAEDKLHTLVVQLLDFAGCRELFMQNIRHSASKIACPYQGVSTALHILSIFGLMNTAAALPGIQLLRNVPDGFGWFPFDYAIYFKERSTCLWLLEISGSPAEPRPDISTSSPLHSAALLGWDDVVCKLLTWGYYIERLSGDELATPLAIAASEGSRTVLECLLAAGANVNCIDKDGQTPLLRAAERNQESLILPLLDAGANVNVHGKDGASALHFSVWNNNLSMTKLLLDHGVDLESPAESYHNQAAIHCAAEADSPDIIQVLYDSGAELNVQDEHGWTALHTTALHGHVAAAQLLISLNANAQRKDNYGKTALHISANQGHTMFIRQLFSMVPRLNANSLDNEGRTALHCAASEGHLETVSILLQNHAADTATYAGDFPLHLAALNGHEEIVRRLSSPETINVRGGHGATPLLFAVFDGHLDLVKTLLNLGADPHIQDDYGQNAITRSLYKGQKEIVASLLQDGADKKFLDRFGNNLLFLATHARNREVVKKLLDEGHDANVSNIYGETPFKMAVASDEMEIFDLFFKRGLGDVSTVSRNGTNSIHVAASRGNEKIVDLLITAGVKADALAVNGRSTLHAAAFGGNVAIIDRLSHLGIDVNNPETERGPPLVLAAGRGYYKVVDRLLELNADIHKTSKHERMDALLVASAYRRPKVVRRLLAAGADPCQRDAYGFTALDYAHRHLRTWEAMGEARAGYTPISAATHRKLIHTTIRKSIQALIVHVEPLEPEYEDERVELLVVLGYNLLRIHGNDSHEAALQCLIELAFPPDLAVFSCNFNCHMCHAPRNPRDVYICQQCFMTYLCKKCHAEYLIGDRGPLSPAKEVQTLEILEREVQVMRLGIEGSSHRPTELYSDMFDLGLASQWPEEKLGEYSLWEKRFNEETEVKEARAPGKVFLKLLQEARNAKRMTECLDRSSTGWEDRLPAINEKFAQFYRKYPERDLKDFICSGHRYLHVSEKMKKTGEPFNSHGRLSRQWLEKLLEKYQDHENPSASDGNMISAGVTRLEPEQPTSQIKRSLLCVTGCSSSNTSRWNVPSGSEQQAPTPLRVYTSPVAPKTAAQTASHISGPIKAASASVSDLPAEPDFLHDPVLHQREQREQDNLETRTQRANEIAQAISGWALQRLGAQST